MMYAQNYTLPACVKIVVFSTSSNLHHRDALFLSNANSLLCTDDVFMAYSSISTHLCMDVCIIPLILLPLPDTSKFKFET